jgi:PAS domain S-box-containing protein
LAVKFLGSVKRSLGQLPVLPDWFQHEGEIRLVHQIFACLAFLAILLTSCCTSAWAEAPAKNVLLLFSGRFNAPLSIAVDEAVRMTFQRSPSMKVELYAETLDVARFDPERYGPLLAAYLREKFADRKLDLIITSLPQAPRFLLKFRKELFPDSPIVFCLADESELADLTPAPNVTGVPIRIPWKETLDLALGVHPDTQHVVVIAGSDGLARVYLRQTQQLFRPYENRLAFTYLTDRTLPQLLKEVASLPPHTVIIYTTFAMDGAGQVYIDAEVSGIVAKAANAPVYGINKTFFGRGITGGDIIDNGAHATRAAEIGLRILAGEKPEAIIVGDIPSPPMFDARQLKRWKISERRLPAGSIVQFKDPSLWEQYRLLILTLGVCLLEALLILALLVHRRRRRLAEARLRESEQRFRKMADAAHMMVWMSGPDKGCTYFNQSWLNFTGRRMEQEVGDGWTEGVHPEDLERAVLTYSRMFDAREPFELEYRLRRFDGEYRWIIDVGTPLYQDDGRFCGYLGSCLDITERKRAEEERQLLAAVVESSHDAIYSLDPDDVITSWNPGAERLFGYTAAEVKGQPVWFLVPPEAREETSRALKRVRAGEPVSDFETVRRRKDGADIQVSIAGAPIRSSDGAIVGVATTVRDVTAHRHAEVEAERLRREIAHISRVTLMGELTASLAHELNQPLTAIMTNAHAGERYLAQAAPPLGELREILADVAADARRAGEVIHRLRSLLKKDAARFRPLDLNEVIREVVTLTRSDAIIRRQPIELALAPDLPPVVGDRVQLQQVLLNLVLNGMEAMAPRAPAERQLRIRTLREASAVRVGVQDEGPGIPPDKLEAVFDTFFTTKPNGMGMGLAISRSIVEAHGGRIWAENNPERGATFWFALPLPAAVPPPGAPA